MLEPAVVAEDGVSKAGGQAAEGDDEIHTTSFWTVPNAVSALRVVLLIPLGFAVARRHEMAIVVILVAIGVTDWADGVIARALRQISSVGQFFDPVCDRIAVTGSLVAIVAAGYYPAFLGAVVFVREGVISIATVVMGLAGWPRPKVTLLGKAATLMLMFSMPLFVIARSDWDSAGTAGFLARAFAYPGAFAYYIALVQYGFTAWRLAPSRREAS